MLPTLSVLGNVAEVDARGDSASSSSLSDLPSPISTARITPPPSSPNYDAGLTPAESVKRRRARYVLNCNPTDSKTRSSKREIPRPPVTPVAKARDRRHASRLPPSPDSLPRTRRKPSKAAVEGIEVRELSTEQIHTVIAPSESGVVESVGKILLIQERLRHDPWRMLVATSLLNVTSGRAARPVYDELMRRWPDPQALVAAEWSELVALLYPLGLFNQRSSSLIRFSQQYIDLGWPLIPHKAEIPPGSSPPLPTPLDVRVFHGAGVYASDSFRIYSDLLPGRGGPEKEGRWLEKRGRAMGRMSEKRVDGSGMGAEEVGEWMSDEEEGEEGEEDRTDAWRSVRPKDKELRRYLVWRWGIEGIVYDINSGPRILRSRDRRRLKVLCPE